MKRADWIIAGFLAVLLLMVVGGGLIFWLQAQAAQNAPLSEPNASFSSNEALADGITAGNALQLAQASAQQQWQADAVTVSASATIVRFETIDDLYTGKASWAVVYYSPISSSVATYTVLGNEAKFLNAKPLEEAPETFNSADIRLDSGQAMTVALASGGDELFQGEAQRVATLKVEKNTQSSRLEWQIAIQNETSGAYKFFRIDAITGEVLVSS